jgi:acid phosphatase type 7
MRRHVVIPLAAVSVAVVAVGEGMVACPRPVATCAAAQRRTWRVRSAVLALLAAALTVAAAPAPAFGQSVTVVAAGDIACSPSDPAYNGGSGTATRCQQKWTAQQVGQIAPQAVLPLGDVVYNCGGASEFQKSYAPTWGAFRQISRPTIGNHEYQASGGPDCTPDGSGYFTYFGSALADPLHNGGYYSWNVGSWHVVALNSNCSLTRLVDCAAQTAWLKADLSKTTQPCILAYFHHPLFSNGGNATASVKPFWQALYAAHADVVLNGHAHIYERYPKRDPSGSARSDGAREFIVGTGGKSLGTVGTPPAGAIANATTFGVLRLTLDSASYRWSFEPDGHSGSFTDSGQAACN